MNLKGLSMKKMYPHDLPEGGGSFRDMYHFLVIGGKNEITVMPSLKCLDQYLA